MQRLIAGALLGLAALGIPTLLLVAITVFGGRYQTAHGTEDDMWVLSVLYPAGAALAGAIGFAFAPWVRRAWQAALLGSTAMVPLYAFISIASEPHGPRPYRIEWALALLCAALVGGVSGVAIFQQNHRRSRNSRRRHRDRAA